MTRSACRSTLLAVAVLCLSLSAASCGSGEDHSQAEAAVAQYRAYLVERAAALTSAVEQLTAPIRTDKVLRAQSFYTIARVPYGQVEVVAESFADLDPSINAHASEVPASEFAGFHRIEKGLWDEVTTDRMGPVAEQLLADVGELRRRLRTVDLPPERIAGGAESLLAEVLTSKLAGDEAPYARSDLVDVSANVEGVEAAFEALKPALAEEDLQLGEIETQFDKVYAALGRYGQPARDPDQFRPNAPGAIFTVYTDMYPAQIRSLEGKIEALNALLSPAFAQIAE